MSRIFASKTNYAFWQTIFIAIVAVGAMLFLSLKAYQLSSLYLAVLIHKIKDACGCESMAQFFSMHPDIFRALIIFGAGIGIFILYCLYKLAKSISRTKKYIGYNLSFARARHSAKLKTAENELGLDNTRIVEINKPDPTVFCYGFWRPKICVSTALVDILDKNELKAVLLHEAQHMTSYDPFKAFIAKYFGSIFFFLPGIENSVKKYITFSELSADEKASKNSAERSGLASAILKISEQEERRRRINGASLSFFNLAIAERANRLSDETYAPEFKFLDRSLIFGSMGLVAISFLVLLVFSDSTKAFEMHNNNGCIVPENPSSDLFCSLTSQQKNSNTEGVVVHNMESAISGQNSFCDNE